MSAHLGKDRTLLIDGDYLVYYFGHSAESKYWQAFSKEGELLYEDRYKKVIYEALGDTEYELKQIQVQDEPAHFVLARIDEHLNMVFNNLNSRNHIMYIGGEGNYRHDFVDDYKANRPPRPLLYAEIRQHLIDHWDALPVHGMEADDAIGIEMTFNPDAVICTIDKDLDMIPGWHYNLNKYESYYVTEEEANLNFYCQLLTGDATDNIRGLYGIGRKKAEKHLTGCSTEEEFWRSALQLYSEREGLEGSELRERVLGVANLIWIMREPQQLWEPPDEQI